MTWILHQGVGACPNNIPRVPNNPHAQTAKTTSLPQKECPPQKRQDQHSRTCSFHAVWWNQATALTFLTQREWGQKQGYHLLSLSSLKEKGQTKSRLHKWWYPTTASSQPVLRCVQVLHAAHPLFPGEQFAQEIQPSRKLATSWSLPCSLSMVLSRKGGLHFSVQSSTELLDKILSAI